MEDLIKALHIFMKYSDTKYPTHCEHDIMYIRGGITADDVSAEDQVELEELGFHYDDDADCFASYKFGSC